jgi:methylphosphotriester-DNA--protein-cysteine methyltransferase
MTGDLVTEHRVLPDGCMDLLFDLSGTPGPTATLVGTMKASLLAPAATRAHFLGVRFRPGEAFAFTRVPAGEVTDRVVPLANVLGPLAERLSDELAIARSTAARLAALDRRLTELRQRARPADPRVRRAVLRIASSPAEARVAWLARDLGLGERQLERIFLERVGVGPKAFARVVRLQALLPRLASGGSAVPWAAIAIDLGYADQAHMIREVKRLSGLTPTELARSRAIPMSDSFNPPSRVASKTEA